MKNKIKLEFITICDTTVEVSRLDNYLFMDYVRISILELNPLYLETSGHDSKRGIINA